MISSVTYDSRQYFVDVDDSVPEKVCSILQLVYAVWVLNQRVEFILFIYGAASTLVFVIDNKMCTSSSFSWKVLLSNIAPVVAMS